MPDPDTVAIPVLAGAALAQGITFLYGQAAEVLRIKREGKAAPQTTLTVPGAFEPKNIALQPNPAALAARARDLVMLLQIAKPFATCPPADLDGTDETLRTCFGHLREVLEDIYDVQFTFVGEQRSTQRVRQAVDDVRGRTTGMKLRGTNVKAAGDVVQRVKTVHESGELTGIDIDLRA
ncbi:hypothetical protein ABH926_007203 [Catenulispora sp. GP43]|uniref:hypothetical protein n=1 Tax=Catenulispora sp. GP43 TaxID=3156263 RepID=UPI003511CF4B